MLLLVSVGDAGQHPLEARTPVPIVRRKIRPTVKRLPVRSKKSRQRPPTLPAYRTDRSLVPAVNVRTLVAVHLHRNKMLIHNGRNFRVIVGLAVHHMAPVAPHRANVEQHGFVRALRRGKRLLAPLMPLNGLVHGGPQVGGRSAGERVQGLGSHGSFSLNVCLRSGAEAPKTEAAGGSPPTALSS